MAAVEPRWEPYREYMFRKAWMEGREKLLFKYGASPIPKWEHKKLEEELKKLTDELK